MMVAFVVVRRVFPGRTALEFGSILSFAVPGTVVGIGYILAFNSPPLLLTGSLAILVLCFVFRYVPVGIQSGIAVLRQIDKSIEEAAQNLGADGLTTFRKVTLPLIAPAFFSGLVYAFVRAMTAISAAIFLVSGQLEPHDGPDPQPGGIGPAGCCGGVQRGRHCHGAGSDRDIERAGRPLEPPHLHG
jgi:iron(III) transport system permease protein